MARIVRLIYCEDRRGNGTENDPSRMIPQLWNESGELVAEFDPVKKPFFESSPEESYCFFAPKNIPQP